MCVKNKYFRIRSFFAETSICEGMQSSKGCLILSILSFSGLLLQAATSSLFVTTYNILHESSQTLVSATTSLVSEYRFVFSAAYHSMLSSYMVTLYACCLVLGSLYKGDFSEL